MKRGLPTNSVATQQLNSFGVFNSKRKTEDYSQFDSNSSSAKIASNAGLSSSQTQSFIPFPQLLLEAIVTATDLDPLEKLFLLLVNGLSIIHSSSSSTNSDGIGQRSYSFPASSWSLILSCSKSKIFSMQKSLADKGYFILCKSKNKLKQNNRNLIIPSLPSDKFDSLFKTLAQKGNSRFSFSDSSSGSFSDFDLDLDISTESDASSLAMKKMTYIDRAGLFIPINYHLLKQICSDESLNHRQKLIWIDFLGFSHRKSLSSNGANSSFTLSMDQMMRRYNVLRSSLSRDLSGLADLGFISANQFFSRDLCEKSNVSARQDRLLWQFSLLLPPSYVDTLVSSSSEKEAVEVEMEVDRCEDLNRSSSNFSPCDPPCADSSQYIKKDIKSNSLKDRSSAGARSNFCKNSFLKESEDKIEEKKLTLRSFYPLLQSDCDALQKSSGREFSLNAMNEILLDMSERLTDRFFRSKKGFMSYFSKALSWEKRDAMKVAGENFRIKKNNKILDETVLQVRCQRIESQDIAKKQEEYLTKLEYSLVVSPEDHLKKKIASVFERDKAYEILTSYRRSYIADSNDDAPKSFVIELERPVALTDHDRKILLDQIKASHERLDFTTGEELFIDRLIVVTKEKEKEKENRQVNEIGIGQGSGSTISTRTLSEKQKESEESSSQESDQTRGSDIWSRVRQELIAHYNRYGSKKEEGSFMDRNWFSKLEASESETEETAEKTKKVTLKAPSAFIRDWIANNYALEMAKIFKNEGIGWELV